MIEILNTTAGHWWSWMWPMLWQSSLLILAVGLADLLARRWTWPQVRYALYLLLLVKLLLPPSLSSPASLAGALFGGRSIERLAPPPTIQIQPAGPQMTSQSPLDAPVFESSPSQPAPLPPPPEPTPPPLSWQVYLMAVWFAGVVLLSSWVVLRFRALRHDYLGTGARSHVQAACPVAFDAMLRATASQLRLRRLPAVVFSSRVQSPAVFGVWRPVLVMPLEYRDRALSASVPSAPSVPSVPSAPPATTPAAPDAALRHILLHELAHIKRGDLHAHALFILLQILYWLHPLLWIVRRRLQYLRELCCDATVSVVLKEKTTEYRETLLQTAARVLRPAGRDGLGLLGLMEQPGNLLERLRRLEKKIWRHSRLRFLAVAVTVGIMFAAVLPMVKSQPAPAESKPSASWSVQEYQDYFHRTRWYFAGSNISCQGEIPGYRTTRRHRSQRNLVRGDRLRIDFTETVPSWHLYSFHGVRKLRVIEGITAPLFEELDVHGTIASLIAFTDDRVVCIGISRGDDLSAPGLTHENALKEGIRVFREAYPQLAARYWPTGPALPAEVKKERVGLPESEPSEMAVTPVGVQQQAQRQGIEPQQTPTPDPNDEALLQALLEMKKEDGRDNAMIHYVRAFQLWPGMIHDVSLTQEARARGWSSETAPLLPVLQAWQPSFAEIRKGAALDYARNIGWKEGPLTKVPNFLPAQAAAGMLAVEARYFESRGKYTAALEDNLTALTMGRDLGARGASLIGGQISMYVESLAATQIGQMAEGGRLDRASLLHAQARLQTIEETQEPFANWWLGEDAFIKWQIDNMRRELGAPPTAAEIRQFDQEIEKTQDEAKKKEMRQGRQGMEELKQRRQRLEHNNVDALSKRLLESMQRYFSTPVWQRTAEQKEDYDARWLGCVEEFHSLNSIFAAVGFPNMDELDIRHEVMRSKLRESRVVVALAICRLDKGRYPSRLDELVPAHIKTMPLDPFSGKPFGYRLVPNHASYELWSVGPDRKDDSGSVRYDPTNGSVSAGDVVLATAQSQPKPTEPGKKSAESGKTGNAGQEDNPLGLSDDVLKKLFETGQSMRQVLTAVRSYRIDNQRGPEKMDNLLKPVDYLGKVPSDPFGSDPLKLVLSMVRDPGTGIAQALAGEDAKARVYSVGPDGKWNDGKAIDSSDPSLAGDLGAELDNKSGAVRFLADPTFTMHLEGKRLAHYLASKAEESVKPTPAAAPENVSRTTTQTLVWGPEVDGLRAALELVPEQEAYPLGQVVGVRLHVRNVSRRAIQLAGSDTRQDTATFKDSNGKTMAGHHIGYLVNLSMVRRTLQPGETAVFKSFGLGIGIAASEPKPGSTLAGNILDGPPGKYTVTYSLRFFGVSQPEDWQGVVETGPREITVKSAGQLTLELDHERMGNIVSTIWRQYGARVCFEDVDYDMEKDVVRLGGFIQEMEAAAHRRQPMSPALQKRLQHARSLLKDGKSPDMLFDQKFFPYSGRFSAPTIETLLDQLTSQGPYAWKRISRSYVVYPRAGSVLNFPVSVNLDNIPLMDAVKIILDQSPGPKIGIGITSTGPGAPKYLKAYIRGNLRVENSQAIYVLTQAVEYADGKVCWAIGGYKGGRALHLVDVPDTKDPQALGTQKDAKGPPATTEVKAQNSENFRLFVAGPGAGKPGVYETPKTNTSYQRLMDLAGVDIKQASDKGYVICLIGLYKQGQTSTSEDLVQLHERFKKADNGKPGAWETDGDGVFHTPSSDLEESGIRIFWIGPRRDMQRMAMWRYRTDISPGTYGGKWPRQYDELMSLAEQGQKLGRWPGGESWLKDKSEDAIRERIRQLIGACAKNDEAAVRNSVREGKIPPRNMIKDMRESQAAGAKPGEIRSITISGERALVVTEFFKIADKKYKDQQCLIYTLERQGSEWRVSDIDMESVETLVEEVQRFQEAQGPPSGQASQKSVEKAAGAEENATGLPVAPASQPLRMISSSQFPAAKEGTQRAWKPDGKAIESAEERRVLETYPVLALEQIEEKRHVRQETGSFLLNLFDKERSDLKARIKKAIRLRLWFESPLFAGDLRAFAGAQLLDPATGHPPLWVIGGYSPGDQKTFREFGNWRLQTALLDSSQNIPDRVDVIVRYIGGAWTEAPEPIEVAFRGSLPSMPELILDRIVETEANWTSIYYTVKGQGRDDPRNLGTKPASQEYGYEVDAISRDGRKIETYHLSSTFRTGETNCIYRVHASLKDIRSFQVRRRPVEWVAYRGVWIKPAEAQPASPGLPLTGSQPKPAEGTKESTETPAKSGEQRTPTGVLAPEPENEIHRRVLEEVYVLRHYVVLERADVWAEAIRKLTSLGGPAVPELVKELRRGGNPHSQSAIAYALRAIGDRRAVPGLIRALAHASGSGSDYGGITTTDPELDRFMTSHQRGSRDGNLGFNFGRPVNEITETLEKLTGHSEGHEHVMYHNEEGKIPSVIRELTPQMEEDFALRLRQASGKWRIWWNANKAGLLNPAQLAEAESWTAPPQSDPVESAGLAAHGSIIPFGPTVSFGSVAEVTLAHATDGWNGDYMDFDSGKRLRIPQEIKELGGGQRIPRSNQWFRQNGVDVGTFWGRTFAGDKHIRLQNAHSCFVWPVDNARWDTIEREIRENHPPSLGDPQSGFGNIEEKSKTPLTYLIRTREGGVGMVQLLGFNADSSGIRIRYKMLVKAKDAVQPASPEPPMEGSQPKPAGKSSASSEKSVPSEKKRILVLPEDRSVGTVWVRERGSSDYRDDMDARKWEKVCDARSRVEIGGNKDAKLQVEKADRTDLSFLKNLKADDLYALSLGWVPTPNVQLQALEHLTGLGELELMETSITDEGLEHLKPLKALRKLSIGQGNITDSGLEYLAGLTALEVLDARSSRIRGPGLAHLKNLASLRILFLGSNPIDDAGLKDLPKLQSLEHLSLWGCPLSDASMPFLGRLTGLKKLDLWGTRVTDAGMVHLEGLRNLTFLRLDNTKVGDAGIGRLKDMRTLEELYLNYTQVTGKGILQLSPLTRLRVLKLDNTAVDDEAMTIVKNLPALEMLEMSSGAKVTDKGLKHLEGHPALNCVVVHNITDQGLASLSRIPSLKRLQIYDSNLTPEGIATLGKLKLEHLAVQGRTVTDALVPAITRLSTVKELSFNNARITDEALQLLQTMTSLQTIYLYDTQISKEGLEEFRKARPNCRINSSDSLPTRDVAAKNAAVMKKFQEVYRLEEGEVLRRIAPPFIPERADFYRLEDPSQAQAIPEPPDYFIFRWDGVLGGPGMGFMGSSVTLSNVLHFWNLLERYEYEGPKELLEMSVPGDWIVRKNADRKEVLRTLERILEKDLRRKIRFTEREVEREVTVVRGKYEFHPIPGSKVDWESVHVYVETLDRDEGAGGGSGDLAEFLRWVGSRLNRCVINETDSYSTKMQWRNNMDSIRGGIQDDPAKIAKVFENLARQTSLDFKTERRKVKVWFVTEK